MTDSATGKSHRVAFYSDIFYNSEHTHTTHQVTIGTTQVASNPRAGDGPGHFNPQFTGSYVVEL